MHPCCKLEIEIRQEERVDWGCKGCSTNPLYGA